MMVAPDLEPIREFIDVGDFPTALRHLVALDGAELEDSQRGQVLALRVICHRRAGRLDLARGAARGAIRDEGENEAYLFGAAHEFADMGDFQLAEELLRELCQLDPDSHQYCFFLATVLDREDRVEEASALYDEAIGLDPTYAHNYLHKAHCLQDLGQLDAAIRVYQHYLKLAPEDANEWMSLATALSDMEAYEAAYEAFKQATDLEPTAAATWYNWAISAIRRRDRLTLASCLERIEKLAPRDWRSAATRALLHEYDGDVQGGWIASRRAIELADRQDEGEDERIGAIVACLNYAVRHNLTTPATDILERCFSEDLFDADVLDALRTLNDQRCDAAGEYEVVLDSAVPPLMAEELDDRRVLEDERYRLVRHYQVFAESEEHATNIVLQFEAHAGATDLVVQSVAELRRDVVAVLGIAFRSRGYLVYLEDPSESDEPDEGWDDEADGDGFFFPRF